jgi:EAL domain-containing protein (putative c-di-GMP-specific phosphodiesterase class I)
VRQHDTLARLGGDEFGLLLEDCSKEMAARITEKVLTAVHECRFHWRDQVFRLGASIGVAILSDPHQTPAQAFSAADSACYAAKEMGRNRVNFFRTGDEALARRIGEMGWVSRIHRALEEDRFVLFGQPVLPLRQDGRSRGIYCEVLTRLREPDGELIEAGAFIPAAERYGLMPRIDQWVVRRVLEQLADARPRTDATVTYGINLSALSLTQGGMLDWFKELLRACSLAPQTLCLEITETAAISNLALASQFIAELKQLGCAFALDDFGSGMSSFTYLRQLGVDYLKIDGSFVVGAVSEPVDRAMIDAINRVGHTMGIQTIAEWVEGEAALGMLRKIGVDYVQGFAVARPRPFEEVVLGSLYVSRRPSRS